jgi:type IX secretion system substrate protein
MKALILTLLCFFSFVFSQAQSLSSPLILAAADLFTSSGGSLEWTLGNVLAQTYQQGNGYFSPGSAESNITGIDETVTNILVYPNPTHDFLLINTVETGNYRIEVFNMQGQKLISKNLPPDATNIHHIDVRNLEASVYLVRILNIISKKNASYKIEKY